jgi:hypothetical protein
MTVPTPNRREFLKSTLATTAAISLPTVTFLATKSQAQSQSQSQPQAPTLDLTANLIWSADSLPVPTLREGHAVDIASSANGPTPVAPVETPDIHSVFVKHFSLETLPTAAHIHLFAYTRYRLYVNGKYLGRGPCRFQNQHPEYDTRDILAALHPGPNVVAILVHRDAPTGRIMRHAPGLAAIIQIAHSDLTQSIPTDPSWLSQPDPTFGPRNEAWASIEEHIDARKSTLLDPVSSGTWKPSVPIPPSPEFFQIHPRSTPLQFETLTPWANPPAFPLTLQPNQPVLLNLAQIVQGYHTLDLEATPGAELEVAYNLPESNTSGRGSYIAREGRQFWMSGDTFALNQLAITLKSGHATLHSATATEVRYPFQRIATLKTSDPYLDQLFTICARSLELLSEDSYIDCADRERVEWTDDSPPAFDMTRVTMSCPVMQSPATPGPAIGLSQTSSANYGDSRLLGALLRRIALTQQPDGQIKAHSCSERFDIHAIMEDRSCDWVILLRQYAEASGNYALLRELQPTLDRLLQWFEDRLTPNGLVQARDWEVWDNPLRYQVCEAAGLNALYYRALRDAAALSRPPGIWEIPARKTLALNTKADSLQQAFNQHLWNEQEGTYDGALFGPTSKRAERLDGKMFQGPIVNGRYQPTAQAALFALYCDIVPADRIPAVQKWLLAHLDQVTGPMSHYYLFHALYNMQSPDRDTQVLDLMRKAWKPQVDSPWQTTWESLAADGSSRIHTYGMAPGSFLITHVLGVRRISSVQYRQILIEPRPGNLTHAQGTAVTEFGPVPMQWSKSPTGTITLELTTPENTHPTLHLYKQGASETILIDNQPAKATTQGPFLTLPLTPGQHKIQYPA